MNMTTDNDINDLIKLVGNVFDAFTSALFLVNETKSKLILKAYHSLSRSIVEGTTIKFGQGLVGWVAQNEESLNVSKFKHDTKTLQFYSIDEEIKSFMAVPVFLSGLVGVLCVDSKKSYVFTSKMQKLLLGFAEQFSRLIHHSREKEQKEKSSADIKSIYEFCKKISSANNVEKILNFLCNLSDKIISYDGFFISLIDDEDRKYKVVKSFGFDSDCKGITISSQHSLMGWVIRNGSTLNISNLAQESKKTYICSPYEPNLNVRSFLGIPLQVENRILGVLGFTRNESDGFNNNDIQVASIIGYHGSIALAHAKLNEKWNSLEFIDSVTDFYNIRYFHENIEKILNRVSKKLYKLALFFIEIDQLERIKERFGYGVRDGVIKQVAEVLRGFLGKEDLSVRYSENNFLLLIQDIDLDKAEGKGEKIREILEQAIFVSKDKEVNATVSIGISLYPDDGNTKQELIDKAILAFMTAKKSGMNRVCSYKKIRGTVVSPK